MKFRVNSNKIHLVASLPAFNPICVILFLVFIALKSLGKIDWSWGWVTAPIWGWWVFTILYFTAVAVFVAQNQHIFQNIEKRLERLDKIEERMKFMGITIE